MSNHPSNTKNSLGTVIKKFFLSAFVVLTFLAYVLHERFTAAIQSNSGKSSVSTPSNGAETIPVSKNDADVSITSNDDEAAPINSNQTAGSAAVDTPTPQPVVSIYKDGTYTGSEANAYYGFLQVQAVIQNGKITAVNFLEYPNHRRTSERINSQAMPWLQQEAIQAQSAQVDLISGATLTSEAFVASLRVALASAKAN